MSRTLIVASAVCAMSAAAFLTPVQASPVSGLTTSKLLPAQSHDRQGRLAPLRTLELHLPRPLGLGLALSPLHAEPRLLMRTVPERRASLRNFAV